MSGKKREKIHQLAENLENLEKKPITQETLMLNVMMTVNRASIIISDLKNGIKEKKHKMDINELFILAVEIELLIDKINEIKQEHCL